MSLFRRIWLTIIGLTVAAFIGSLLVNVLTARGYLEKQLFIKNQDNATALALSMSQQPDKDPVTMELLLAALFDNGHYQEIRLTDPAGKILVERTAAADPDLGAPAWFVALLPIRVAPGVAHISDGWKQYGTISLISHSRFAYNDLWYGALELGSWFLLGGIVAGLLGSLMLRRIVRPLDQVVAQARAIAERRFVTIEEPEVPELKSVVSAMNDMVARVKEMFAEEAAQLDLMRRKLDIDASSGLPSRDLFMSRLRNALENENSAAAGLLAILRLNDLGAINRKLGHVETDKLIRAIGDMLNALCGREGNCLVARLSGTDFAYLEQHGASAGSLGMRLAQAMLDLRDERRLAIDEFFHIGVTCYKRGDALSMVLSDCDRLLAQAESKGANTVMADARDANAPAAIPSEAWRELIALAIEEGRVRLVDFPVVDLRKASLMHREGVVRLQTEMNGPWRPAGDFIPFALRLRLTPRIDLLVVKLAIEALRKQAGDLAINLSAETFSNPDLRAQFLAPIKSQGRLVERLWIEVPEDAVVGNFDSFHELCRSLKALGCKIGIENFGRKLAVGDKLAALGIDFVKLDNGFVRGIDQNEGNREFLARLCKMVHGIGIQAIAVGVQNRQELETLAALGFDGVTGPGVHAPG